MDGQPEKSNNLQEGSQSQLSSVKMKVETSDADSSSCNKDGNKTPHSPFMQGISSNRPVFGATGKLGSPAARLPFSFGSSNPFSPKSTTTFGASPKLNCASPSFGSLSSPKPVFLRPSQLAVSNDSSPQASNNTFPLKPSSLGNPFARVTSENENEPSKEDKVAETSDVSKNSSDRIFSAKIEASKTDSSVNANDVIEKSPQKTDSGSGSTSSSSSSSSYRSSRGVMSPPKFVPLGTPARHPEESSSSNANIAPTNATNASTTSTSTTSSSNVTGFVFGQNLHERVAEAVTNEAVDSSSRTSELAGTSNNVSNLCASATTNGTSEMLFTSVIKKDHISENNHNNSNSNNETGEKPSKSLSEAAREYEEARAVKRKYEEVQVITGEEDEVNVLQMNCKLFAFDKAGGTWVERGRGTLRLNDKTSGPLGGGVQSRVVIRTTGTLRVVLNTKIWAGMSVDRPSLKSVRLTAMDNSGQIKVFLVMCSPKETEQLHRSLECRVDIARRASASQNQTQNETKSSEHDLASHSLPPEPCSKKRLSEDSSPTPDVTSV